MKPAVSIVVVVLLMVAAGFIGYDRGRNDESQVIDPAQAQENAAGYAFALANLRALGDGIDRGFATGVDAGADRAEALGEQRGTTAAERLLARDDSGGAGPQPSGQIPTLDGSGAVLVVGDSLEVGTSPYLGAYLPGVRVQSSAEVGYTSDEIRGLFEDAFDGSQSVIVFDAGTNDSPTSPDVLAGNLQAVAAEIGDRCMVVPTINGPTIGGVDSRGLNRVVQEFAASRPGTQVPDWAGAVRANPDLMQPDGIHALPSGYDLRASLISDGIRACLGEDVFSLLP